jgi:hypothetical protein
MIDCQIAVCAAVLTSEIVALEDEIPTWLLRIDPTHRKSDVAKKSDDLP